MFNQIKKVLRKDVSDKDQKAWEEKCRKIWSESKVLIGLPNTGTVEDMQGESPLKSILHLVMYTSSQKESTTWGIQPVARMITHEARNALAKQAIDCGYTHLAMIDSDHVFDKDVIHRLLLYQKGIVGVRAYKRTPPHFPCIFVNDSKLPDTEAMIFADAADRGLMIADAVGFGIILISVEVLKKLTYPYFYFNKTGEDFNFCRDAKKAGFKIYVDTDVEIGHVTTKIVRRADYLAELNSGKIRQFDQDMLKLIQDQKNDKNVDFDKIAKN